MSPEELKYIKANKVVECQGDFLSRTHSGGKKGYCRDCQGGNNGGAFI